MKISEETARQAIVDVFDYYWDSLNENGRFWTMVQTKNVNVTMTTNPTQIGKVNANKDVLTPVTIVKTGQVMPYYKVVLYGVQIQF